MFRGRPTLVKDWLGCRWRNSVFCRLQGTWNITEVPATPMSRPEWKQPSTKITDWSKTWLGTQKACIRHVTERWNKVQPSDFIECIYLIIRDRNGTNSGGVTWNCWINDQCDSDAAPLYHASKVIGRTKFEGCLILMDCFIFMTSAGPNLGATPSQKGLDFHVRATGIFCLLKI